MALPIADGRTWGDFEILEELGRGGMGAVYKARERQNGRIVALKILLAGSFATEQGKRRFLREAQAGATLHHPHILPVYRLGQEREYPYFTMKYVEGETFGDFMSREKKLESKLEVLIKVGEALQHAHDMKLLHRDIKPSNILLDRQGNPYLVDFGLAKFLDGGSLLTQTGQALGTPFYMAPEQVRGKKKQVGPPADIYSLGVVLYFVVTGKLPFIAESLPALYHKIATEEPAPPRLLNPQISPRLEMICLVAIEKNPRHRYPSAQALSDDLARFCRGEMPRACRFDLRRSLRRSSRRILSSRRAWALILAAAFMVPLGIFACRWYSLRQSWHPHYKAAQIALSRGEPWTALKHLSRMKGQPEKLARFQEQIRRQLPQAAKICYDEGHYQQALECVDLLPVSKEMLKLRAQVLLELGRFSEMRLSLVELWESGPTIEELRFMGELSLACGHLDDARICFDRSWTEALSQTDTAAAASLQKRLAWTLLAMGDHKAALRLYQRLPAAVPDAEVLLGLAIVYCRQGKYPQASECLRGADGLTSPYSMACRCFWQAHVVWHGMQLSSWRWLKRDEAMSRQVLAGLADVERQLRQALVYLESSEEDYLARSLTSQARLYLKSLELERGDFGDAEKEVSAMSGHGLWEGSEILLTEAMVRCLIRHRKWDAAISLCDRAIHDFPWAFDFYLLRAIGHFHHGHLAAVEMDTFKAIQRESWNSLPLENMTGLMLSKLGQEEFHRYWRATFRYVFNSSRYFQMSFWDEYVQDLIQHYPSKGEGASESRGTLGDTSWETLWKTAIYAKSAASRDLAVSILAVQEGQQQLLEKLDQVETQALSQGERESLQRIRAAVQQTKKRRTLANFRLILIRHAIFADESYVLEVRRMGEEGRALLEELLSGEELPMMRLLAARMLMATKVLDDFFRLKATAESDKFPANLLAAVAIRESGFLLKLPVIAKDAVFAPPEASAGWDAEDKRREAERFYRMLLALHIHPYLDRQLYADFAQPLLSDEDEFTSLCAASNFSRYPFLGGVISQKKIEERLVAICHSKAENARALAISALWRVDERAQYANAYQGKEEKDILCRRYWEDTRRREELLDALDIKSPIFVQLAAIQSIVGEEFMRSHIQTDVSPEDELWQQLKAKLYDLYRLSASSTIKYWSAMAIASIDKDGGVWGIICDPDVPVTVRNGALLGVISNVQNANDVFEMLRLIDLPIHTESDREFSQLCLLSMGWMANLFIQSAVRSQDQDKLKLCGLGLVPVQNGLLSALKRPEKGIHSAAIAAILWVGDVRTIEEVRPFLESDDAYTSRAAALTIAGLTMRYKPSSGLAFREEMEKYPAWVREGAALGYEESIAYHVRALIPIDVFVGCDLDRQYELFFRYLKFAITRQSARVLENWLTALRHAGKISPNPRYHYESALILRHLKRMEEAQQHIAAALTMLETHEVEGKETLKLHSVLLSGEMRREERQYDNALDILEELSREFPFSAVVHYEMAHTYEEMGMLEKAWAHFGTSYLCDPGEPRPFLRLADISRKKEDYASLFDLANYSSTLWLKVIVDREGRDWVKKGESLYKKGAYQKAVEAFDIAVCDWPFMKRAYLGMARALEKQEDAAGAQRYYFYAYLCFPYTPDALFPISASLLQKGDVKNFLPLLLYRPAWSIPQNESEKVGEMQRLGLSHLESGQLKEAQAIFGEVLDIYPFQRDAHLSLAETLDRQGKIAEARSHFFYSYLCDPSRPQSIFSLAATFVREGKREEAILILQQLQKKHTLTREMISSHPAISSLADDPWVRSLPQ